MNRRVEAFWIYSSGIPDGMLQGGMIHGSVAEGRAGLRSDCEGVIFINETLTTGLAASLDRGLAMIHQST